MSKWNQKYFDEVQELDMLFQRFNISWCDIQFDYEKDRPYSLNRFKEAVNEMLDAYGDFICEVEVINEE